MDAEQSFQIKEDLTAALQLMEEGLALMDEQGRWLFANEAVARLSGLASVEAVLVATPQELMRRFQLTDERGNPLPPERMPTQLALQGQSPPPVDGRSAAAGTGEDSRVTLTCTPLFDAQGKVRRVVTTLRSNTTQQKPSERPGPVQEVTEASEAEEKLRASEERLRLALEAGRMGYFDWNLGTGKSLISPSLEALYGRPPGGLEYSFEDFSQIIHPDDRPWVVERIQRLLQEGWKGDTFTYRIVQPDGAIRWIDGFSKLVCDAAGRPVRLLGIGLDATERIATLSRKQEQEALARASRYEALRADVSTALSREGQLRETLQHCADAMVHRLGAAMSRIWMVNAQAEVLELQGGAGSDPGFGGFAERVPLSHFNLGRIARERRPYLTNDLPNSPRFGNKEWVRAHGVTAFAGYPLVVGEQLVGLMALFSALPLPEDMAPALGAIADALAQGIQRRRAELALASHAAELARSNAELEQFAYVASHDLQEPLRMVASFTELLARRYKGQLDEKADRYINFAIDGVTRMQRLIQDLLAFSRVGTKGQPPSSTDAQRVFQRALANLEAASAESGAEITADPLPTVMADELQLEQLFQNLIGNALKFHSPAVPPRIHVSARGERHQWIFSVKDNGIGIEPQYFERIFVIFQRLHSKTRHPGTGIGLAICKKIVERHGGRIWVESTLGQGSCFFFTLPREKDVAEGAA